MDYVLDLMGSVLDLNAIELNNTLPCSIGDKAKTHAKVVSYSLDRVLKIIESGRYITYLLRASGDQSAFK